MSGCGCFKTKEPQKHGISVKTCSWGGLNPLSDSNEFNKAVERVIEVMRRTPRENFLPDNARDIFVKMVGINRIRQAVGDNGKSDVELLDIVWPAVRQDINQPIYVGDSHPSQKISSINVLVDIFASLDVNPGDRVLVVGGGSGYSSAIISQLTGKKGKVYVVDAFPDMVSLAETNLKKSGCKNASVVQKDGINGFHKRKYYDRILVTGGLEGVPVELYKQLKAGGKMIVPICNKDCSGKLVLVQRFTRQNKYMKVNEDFTATALLNVMFSPLEVMKRYAPISIGELGDPLVEIMRKSDLVIACI